jgi:hypothetical protein
MGARWRFLPTVRNERSGFQLSGIDLPKLKLLRPAALDAAEHFFLSPTGNTSP